MRLHSPPHWIQFISSHSTTMPSIIYVFQTELWMGCDVMVWVVWLAIGMSQYWRLAKCPAIVASFFWHIQACSAFQHFRLAMVKAMECEERRRHTIDAFNFLKRNTLLHWHRFQIMSSKCGTGEPEHFCSLSRPDATILINLFGLFWNSSVIFSVSIGVEKKKKWINDDNFNADAV